MIIYVPVYRLDVLSLPLPFLINTRNITNSPQLMSEDTKDLMLHLIKCLGSEPRTSSDKVDLSPVIPHEFQTQRSCPHQTRKSYLHDE